MKIMDNQQDKNMEKSTGIRITTMNFAIMAVAAVIAAVLLMATYEAVDSFMGVRSASDRYIACQHAADQFQNGSDYLSEECRLFALTGDAAHARNYSDEVEITRRRELAVEQIEEYLVEADSYRYLAEALTCSNALMEQEFYAMRLAAEVYGLDVVSLPVGIQAARLSDEHLSLDPKAQRDVVIDLLFGESYQKSKDLIRENVGSSIDALVDDTQSKQTRAMNATSGILQRQRILMLAMIAFLLLYMALAYFLVALPLTKSVDRIRAHQQIPVNGAYEMRFLARTYNEMYEQHAESTEKLTYSATHDSLTGVHNRTAFDTMRRTLDESGVGVLYVDVDKFKRFNDTYGHDVGDRVLIKVAQVLMDSFRSEDFVSRIGGDEFCVVMMRVSSKIRQLVSDKIARANEKLGRGEDGLPPISISVGVAFGDREHPQGDIFKDADSALYQVKRQGYGGLAFFE